MNISRPSGSERIRRSLHFLLLLPLLAISFLSVVSQGRAADQFSLTGAMSVPRQGHTATRLVDGRVLVAGGLNAGGSLAAAEIFDPGAGSWTATGSLVTARSGHIAVLMPDGKVLIAGGRAADGSALASAELYNPASGTWTATGSMTTPRLHHAATLMKTGIVMVSGGLENETATEALDTTETYNPSSGAWYSTGLLNAARAFHTSSLVNDQVVLMGGISGNTYVGIIDLYRPNEAAWSILGTGSGTSDRLRKSPAATVLPDFRVVVSGGIRNTALATTGIYRPYDWTATGVMTSPRADHTSSLLADGRVLAVGGANAAGALLATSETYAPAGAKWTASASLATARAGHTATALSGGRVLIAGGYGSAGALASCELFTAQLTPWVDMAPMKTGRMAHTATLLASGKLLVTGGEGWGQTVLGSAEVYDPVVDSWTSTGTFGARIAHTATLLTDGRVIVAGGYSSNFNFSLAGTVDVYNPATNTWSASGTMLTPRASHAAVLLPDGKVLVAGGYATQDYTALNSVELYDPVSGTWSAAAPMSTGRNGLSATLMANGRVLVVSGRGDWDPLPGSAEVYDPASNTWTPTGALNNAHYSFGTTLLPDGRVLVAGAYAPGTVGTSELYNPDSNTWSTVATMLSDEFNRTSTLLPDGRVLVTGDDSGSRGEIYNPATNSWSSFIGVNTFAHGATVMPDGRIFFTGGQIMGVDPATVRTRMYNFNSATTGAPRPVITSAYFDETDRLVLAGSGFAGNAAGAPPLVTLKRLDNAQTVSLVPDAAGSWSAGSFTSQPLTGFPQGFSMVTVAVNDIPGVSVIVSLTAPEITVEQAGGAALGEGDAVNFGSLPPGGQGELSFTVRNRGRSDLTGLAVTFTGADAARFALTASPAPSLSGPSGSTVFTIRFTPGGPGLKSAVLHLASNDADENPFDLTLSGAGSNSAPQIGSIANQEIDEDGATAALAFSVSDTETPDALTVSASSSNPALLPISGILVGGSGGNRTVTLSPLAGMSGTAVVTLTVSDGVFQTSSSFNLTVKPVNDPPTLAEIPDPAPLRENAGPQTIALTGLDSGEGAAQALTVSATSDNPALFSLLTVAEGSVRYQPAPDASGQARVTVTADDGQGAANSRVSRSFTVKVLPLLHADSPNLAEGNAGGVGMVFRLWIGSPQTEAVSVAYHTETTAGQAQAGADFTNTSGTAIIPAGAKEAVVTVGIVSDTAFEEDESFNLVLSNPQGTYLATGGTMAVSGVILNDDAQPSLGVTAGSVTESPAGGPFRVWISATLSAPAAQPLTWMVSTRAGTAQDGGDFTALPPTALTFAPGELSKWVAISVGGSGSGAAAATEADEEFYTDFKPATGPGATVTSVCTIRQLAIRDFYPLGTGLYAVRFPTGKGQSYVIEESENPGGPWTENSAIILGSGSQVTQVIFSTKTKAFFRVSAAPLAPGTAAVGP